MPRGYKGSNSGIFHACASCGKEFPVAPYRLKQVSKPAKYCSATCRVAGITKPRLVQDCRQCGKKLPFRAMTGKGSHYLFCDRSCSTKWHSTNLRGSRFGRQRNQEMNMILYGKECAICGFNRVLEFAHLIPAALGGTIHFHNILPLCPNHHKLMDKNLLTEEEKAKIAGKIETARTSAFARRLELAYGNNHRNVPVSLVPLEDVPVEQEENLEETHPLLAQLL